MCTAKQVGGMGFRDPEAFNQALLAKQAWRLLLVPSSLCARVLQARHYKDGSILNATCPAGGSYTFRSIIHGRDLLRAGLVWRIGDGLQVNIHHDQWIPRKGCLTPLGADFIPGVTKVGHLLDQSGARWDGQKLEAMFSGDDARDIKQIVVGGPGVEDCLAWNYRKNGQFTVRSAYHLRMEMNKAKHDKAESSSASDHKSWLALWDSNAPGKAKIHMWRLMRNGLAVGSELRRRTIKAGVFCVACRRDETVFHRFWGCPHSALFWKCLCSETGMRVAIPPCQIDSQSTLAVVAGLACRGS